MAFPPIRYCLVCEDVRPEPNQKTSVLGFFGIAPEVTVAIRHQQQQVKLAFLLLTGQITDAGRYKLSLELLKPAGSSIGQSPVLDVEFLRPADHSQIVVALGPLVVTDLGDFTLRLLVDGQEHYRTTFSIKQGSADDFDDSSPTDKGTFGTKENPIPSSGPDTEAKVQATPATPDGARPSEGSPKTK